MKKTLITIGGGEIRQKETLPIDEYICNLAKEIAGDRRAVALFVGTASHDYMPYYNSFHKTYTGMFGLKTDCALTVHVTYDEEKLKSKFEKADVIYVSGGDTLYMLEAWKKSKILDYILDAYEKGKIVCGLSAGAICWFEDMFTDSYALRGEGSYALEKGLGILKGGACPHFAERKQEFLEEISKTSNDIDKWYCMENSSAIVFEDGVCKKVLSCGGRVYTFIHGELRELF